MMEYERQQSRWGQLVRRVAAFGLLYWLLGTSLGAGEPTASPEEPAAAVRPDEQQKIEEAIPAKAVVRPAKPRKLLIFDLNVGYPGPRTVYPDHVNRLGHRSIAHANLAFTLMGRKTGAFDTVVSRDPSVFKRESLRQFDAVCFNNTVGNLFEDAELRRSLIDFVAGGGGLMGIHGTTVAFTTWPGAKEAWPEFGEMLGARGANHSVGDERVFVKLDDPSHPLNRPFGGEGVEYSGEFFRFHTVYSREKVRVLLSIDTQKTPMDMEQLAKRRCIRDDNDYALAWVRSYGRGRVFYSTIGHDPYVFWDAKMLQFYLGAIQFALGDLPVPTTPSARLTPEVRAQERLEFPGVLKSAK
jgi:type 1 glutamine amidotransferase